MGISFRSFDLSSYMKLRILLCFILALPLLFSNCGEEELTAEEKVTNLLVSGTWKPVANSITIGGDDASSLFIGFTIQFTKNQITTTGTTPVWQRVDTWQFKPGSQAQVIIRGSDNREISIDEITNAQLKISIEWDKTTYGGRVKSLPGVYEFTLTK